MRAAGVRPVVDAASLSVVGLAEVVRHIPRIHGEYRKMIATARAERPDLAILTDSPDFHLRLAPHLKDLGIPLVYLVAPQVWAWRKGRIAQIRRNIDRLLCIFPFEESFFRERGVSAEYIGHPLARLAVPAVAKEEFFSDHRLNRECPLITLLPGSRRGEAFRHIPLLGEAVRRLRVQPGLQFVLALPAGFWEDGVAALKRQLGDLPILVVQGKTWDAIAHADLVLAASGTVTIETALLGTPMVTFYRVSPLTWFMGRRLVDVPFFSMVNLVAGRAVVPELIQHQMTGERLAKEATRLLEDPAARSRMRQELLLLAGKLAGPSDPLTRAAEIAEQMLSMNQGATHVA
jgi:lipid-A-disaccharide synthase